MDTLDVIVKLVSENPQIESVRYFHYNPNAQLQERLTDPTDFELQLISEALTEKKLHAIGFWEALFRASICSENTSDRLLGQGLFHRTPSEVIEVNRQDLEKLYTARDSPTAINSRVLMHNRSYQHIAMLDFDIPNSSRCLHVVQQVVRCLDQKGYILDSGESYHFIGLRLLDGDELTDLLSKFILFRPIADSRWAAHQILERSCSLRLGKKYGRPPTVVGEVT